MLTDALSKLIELSNDFPEGSAEAKEMGEIITELRRVYPINPNNVPDLSNTMDRARRLRNSLCAGEAEQTLTLFVFVMEETLRRLREKRDQATRALRSM